MMKPLEGSWSHVVGQSIHRRRELVILAVFEHLTETLAVRGTTPNSNFRAELRADVVISSSDILGSLNICAVVVYSVLS